MASFGDLSYMSRYGKPKLPAKPKNQSYVTGQPDTINGPLPGQGPASLPLDPIYEAAVGGAGRSRETQLAQFTAARPRLLADFGYTASGYDSSGAPTGLAFDTNNPFSRAALLKRSYEQQQQGTVTSYSARGHRPGLSGALQRQQATNEFGYQQRGDSLQKALTNSLVDVASGERSANTEYENTVGFAKGDRLARAAAQPPAPPAAPAGLPGAGGNPFRPGTQEWAGYAKQHGQSWFQKNGQWYRMGASGKPIRVG